MDFNLIWLLWLLFIKGIYCFSHKCRTERISFLRSSSSASVSPRLSRSSLVAVPSPLVSTMASRYSGSAGKVSATGADDYKHDLSVDKLRRRRLAALERNSVHADNYGEGNTPNLCSLHHFFKHSPPSLRLPLGRGSSLRTDVSDLKQKTFIDKQVADIESNDVDLLSDAKANASNEVTSKSCLDAEFSSSDDDDLVALSWSLQGKTKADANVQSKPPSRNGSHTHYWATVKMKNSSSSDEDLVALAHKIAKREANHLTGNTGASSSNGLDDSQDARILNSPSRPEKRKRTPAAEVAKPKTSPSLLLPNSHETAFCVATYNVNFDPMHIENRMQEIVRLLLERHNPKDHKPLWFVGFQELMQEHDDVLTRGLEAAGYTMVRQRVVYDEPAIGEGADWISMMLAQMTQQSPYYSAIAVYTGRKDGAPGLTVLDAGHVDFAVTRMDRAVVYVRARFPDSERQILFTNTHLESFIDKDNPSITEREAQIRQMEQFCNDEMRVHAAIDVALMVGDMNWDDESKRASKQPQLLSLLHESWRDAWLETNPGPKDTCYTYDGRRNTMRNNSIRMRMDRVLYRTRSDRKVRVLGTEMIGQDPIPGLTFKKPNFGGDGFKTILVSPSDHFGFVSQIALD